VSAVAIHTRLSSGEVGYILDWAVPDEDAPISINYTSGTTGRPKGVIYTHRGAYLNALGEIRHSYHAHRLPADAPHVPLQRVVHAMGGHCCDRAARVPPRGTWRRNLEHDRPLWVTHLDGAPTVVTTIMNAPQAHALDRPLVVTTAGAPPAPATILQMERMGFRIVHIYGLTETYGPYAVCELRPE
jgi:fatty-acyl-CoA synthase